MRIKNMITGGKSLDVLTASPPSPLLLIEKHVCRIKDSLYFDIGD